MSSKKQAGYSFLLFSFDLLFVCLFVCMVQIWQLKFDPFRTIQLSWNFVGVRSLDDNTIFEKKNPSGWKNYPVINKYNP